jgi:hypothetical protein
MTFCTSCGAKNQDESKFCAACGNPIIKIAGSQVSEPLQVSAPAKASPETKKLSANPINLPGQFLDSVDNETNPKNLANAFLFLFVINAVAWFLMGSDSPFKQPMYDQIEAMSTIGFYVVLFILSFFCVKIQSAEKPKVGWLYFLLVLNVVIYIAILITPSKIEKLTKFDMYIAYIGPLAELYILGRLTYLLRGLRKQVK